ncbi:MAG: division/cell wall cluster transcriptional repressor MraZ [Clostridiales bacterium]|nr:division/cell wall cluster transcriptional repressor MraZ [Clostridiales bacterium]
MFERLYRHQLDAKNRMRIPAKFRVELGTKYVITCGTGGCLFVFKEEAMEELKRKLSKVSMFDKKKQDAIRFFLGHSWDAEEDGQGRILIPEELRSYAKFEKNIVCLKNLNWFELWNAEIWDKKMSETSFEDVADVLSGLDSDE